jgi:hypothetical protein
MSLKQPAIVLAAVALCATAGSAPALAQSESCVAQYDRVTALYQIAPLSPEYSQMAAAYSARCLAGASAAPPLVYYGSTTGYGYNGPPYYGYGYNAPAYYGPGYLRTSASTERCNEFDPPLVAPRRRANW